MRTWGYVCGVGLVGLLALAGCAAPLPAVTPLQQAAPTMTPTVELPTATSEPRPTATPLPVPTPDPADFAVAAEQGLAQVTGTAGGADLTCLQYVDTDKDGAPEWVAVVHQPAPVSRLSAFIIDGDVAYPLEAARPEPGKPDLGLGQFATCEVTVRDINADGRPEVAIFGHADQNETLLHLYVWEDGEYRLLGSFRGTAGVAFEDADGDLAEEIVEGHRDTGAADLAWEVIFTWDGKTYGWTADRWAWFFLDRPHGYPAHKPEYAVTAFYLALNDHDMPGAYALMTEEAQSVRAYDTWASGFATTLRVDVSSVHRIPGVGDDAHARVAALVTSWDNEAGRVIGRTWEVEWDTLLTPEGWRLNGGTMETLTTWEASYWE